MATKFIRLEPSCCSPALTAAAACKEVEAVREEGDGVCVRKAEASTGFGTLAIAGEGGMDLEGGNEFRSGIAEWSS